MIFFQYLIAVGLLFAVIVPTVIACCRLFGNSSKVEVYNFHIGFRIGETIYRGSGSAIDADTMIDHLNNRYPHAKIFQLQSFRKDFVSKNLAVPLCVCIISSRPEDGNFSKGF